MKGLIAGLSLFLATNVVAEPIEIKALKVKLDADMACLVRNIYHEARGESDLGQLAVGLVTLQRVGSPHYPDTICKVVYQYKAFSWTLRPQSNEKEEVFYGKCLNAARKALVAHSVNIDINGADHYHNIDANPYWTSSKQLVAHIGKHKFYK